jgi:adenylate cyclase
MAEQRKLATIMAIDVAGYSHAAETDEAAAAGAVRHMRGAIEAIVAPLGGRIFNSAGDGFMVELPTASAGVEAATQVLAAPDAPKVRIGLHLGEVIVADQGDLLGHGVNVAARLQQMAEPGSALVSQAVQTQIRGASVKFTPLGKVQLDKMHERIDVFALASSMPRRYGRVLWRRLRGAAIALAALVALLGGGFFAWRAFGPQAAAETPRLAVLRFEAIGETDPHFTEAVADELISYVSRMEGLTVIARTSSFALSGEDATPAAAAEQLGATLVLTGSVRRQGDRVQVSAQLAEAPGGRLLWSREFDKPISEIGQLQSEIAIHLALATGLRAQPPPRRVDPQAYAFYMRGREAALSTGSSDIEAAIGFYEQAVAQDPDFASAWTAVSDAYLLRALTRWALAPPGVPVEAAEIERSLTAADRAIALDPDAPEPYQNRSRGLRLLGRWQEALRAADEAAARGGNVGVTYSMLGYIRRATANARRGAERDPLMASFWVSLGKYCALANDLACAIDAEQRVRRLLPNDAPGALAIALHRAGRTQEALALTRQQPEAWRQWTNNDALIDMNVIRSMLGQGAPPDADTIVARVARGDGFAESAAMVLVETGRPEAVARVLPYWTESSRPSLAQLYDVRLAALRTRPEFWALMEREGIVQVWRETGQWPDFCETERVCEAHH